MNLYTNNGSTTVKGTINKSQINKTMMGSDNKNGKSIHASKSNMSGRSSVAEA